MSDPILPNEQEIEQFVQRALEQHHQLSSGDLMAKVLEHADLSERDARVVILRMLEKGQLRLGQGLELEMAS